MVKIYGNKILFYFFISILCLFFFPWICLAGIGDDPKINIFDYNGNSLVSFSIQEKDYNGGLDLSSIDLGKDGQSELLVGLGYGNQPKIKIFRIDGSLINEFMAFNENFRGGINLAGCDLDNNGKDEIIAAPAYNGGPHIRIFNGYGNTVLSPGFFVYDKNYRGGIEIACGDFNGDLKGEIAVGILENNKYLIRIYNYLGEKIENDFYAFDESGTGEFGLAVADIDNNGISEIIAGSAIGVKNKVRIFKKDGSLVKEFIPFDEGFTGGVNLSVDDLNDDGKAEILVAPTFNEGPHIRIFDVQGNLISDGFFAFDEKFRGGIKTAFMNGNIAVLQRQLSDPIKNNDYKYIEIDISEQKLGQFQNGYQLGDYIISSGIWDLPTPLGEFKIISKSELAYSNKYKLYMPFWMAFTNYGHGIHGLPYWVRGKNIYYEGENHLGKRASHGCVRVQLENAKKLYYWAEKGTKVVIKE